MNDSNPFVPFDRKKFMLEEWPEALRFGKYKQAAGVLTLPGPGDESRYCCLGVACLLLENKGLLQAEDWRPTDGSLLALPQRARNLLKLRAEGWFKEVRSGDPVSLAVMNDQGYSFEAIADKIVETETSGMWKD